MIGRSKATCSRLRHKLCLQQEMLTTDGVGGYIKTWQNVADVWAELKPVLGSERLFAGQLQSAVTHKILIRYRAGISAGMRFVFDGRNFNIRAVFNADEKHDTLEILAEEGVAT